MKIWLFVLNIFSRREPRGNQYCRRENQYLPDCPLGRRYMDCPLNGDCAAVDMMRRR